MKLKILLSVTFALLTACSSTPRQKSPAETDTAPADIENGRALFQRHCRECHWNGEGGLGPSLVEKPFPKFLIKRQIRIGFGAMPSFELNEISKQELEDLGEYVRRLGKQPH